MDIETWGLVYNKPLLKVIVFFRENTHCVCLITMVLLFVTERIDLKYHIIHGMLSSISTLLSITSLSLPIKSGSNYNKNYHRTMIKMGVYFSFWVYFKNHTSYIWRWKAQLRFQDVFFLSRIMSWGNTVDIHQSETYKDIRARD